MRRAHSRHLAEELDAAQERGEVAKKNQPVSQYVQGSDIPPPATFDEAGIDRRRAAEWRDKRTAGLESPVWGRLGKSGMAESGLETVE